MVKEKEWFKAIRNGHVHVITNLLHALKDKKPGKIQNLVKKLHSVDGTQSTALHLSCQYNHGELVKILLENGANPNILDQSGCTALHMAAWNGNEEICDIIMHDSKVDVKVNATNVAGDTALHLASQHGHDKVVETLLGFGAELFIPNTSGQTALILACRFGRKEVASALIARMSADIKGKLEYSDTETSPLHVATRSGHAQVVWFLVDRGFPVNTKTPDGSALHEAIRWNRIPVVKTLLENNVDVDIPNSEGKTALQLLEKSNQKFEIEMKKLIIEHREKASKEIPQPKPRVNIANKEEVHRSVVEELEAALGSPGLVDPEDSLEAEESPRPPPEPRPSSPELLRRLSSKYRKKYEEITFGDDDLEEGLEEEEYEDGITMDDVFGK